MYISPSPWTFALGIFATLFEGASLINLADNYYCRVPHPWLLLGLLPTFYMKCLWIRSLTFV